MMKMQLSAKKPGFPASDTEVTYGMRGSSRRADHKSSSRTGSRDRERLRERLQRDGLLHYNRKRKGESHSPRFNEGICGCSMN